MAQVIAGVVPPEEAKGPDAVTLVTQFVQPVTVPFMVMEPIVSMAFEYSMAHRVVGEPR